MEGQHLNPHFTSGGDRVELPPIPRTGYARMDDLEVSRSGLTARISFDMVDADWVDKHLRRDSSMFGADTPPVLDFENMPLFHLEIVVRLYRDRVSKRYPWWGAQYAPTAIHRLLSPDLWRDHYFDGRFDPPYDPSAWFFIERMSKRSSHRANIYRSMSGEFESINVEIRERFTSKQLDRVFTLPGTAASTLEPQALALLSGVACDRVVVFDVGQGNANGMVKDGCNGPELFYDVGAGVYGNHHTRPHGGPNLPVGNAKAVILSHWDSDHWAGANIPSNNELLSKTWIAPKQTVGPRQVAFAHRISACKGKLLLLEGMAPRVQAIPLQGGKVLQLTQGAGRDRNDSGLVAAVETTTPAALCRSIILTGDCDYCHFSHLATAPVKGLVVPHHGASLKSDHSDVPSSRGEPSTLAYSFGPNNAHGKSRVRHPTIDGVALHSAWHHGSWLPSRPGVGNPGPQVLATSDHTYKAPRGDVYLDW